MDLASAHYKHNAGNCLISRFCLGMSIIDSTTIGLKIYTTSLGYRVQIILMGFRDIKRTKGEKNERLVYY